jgi:hypothetical protein
MNGSELKIGHGDTVALHVSRCGLSRAQLDERAQDAVRWTTGTMPRLNERWGRRVRESPCDIWRTASFLTTNISLCGRGGMATCHDA